jgi:beta-glucuronidase
MHNSSNYFNRVAFFLFILGLLKCNTLFSQLAVTNLPSHHIISLNGKWDVIIDPTGIGEWRKVWLEQQPEKKTDFFEYSFEGGPQLTVPGDFNSQLCELKYFEGTVWYRKVFDYPVVKGQRLYLSFGAVNYLADVYLNGEQIGSHEGGFTPFQFEITQKVKQAGNHLVVKVTNSRLQNGLPGLGYDWLNFGGITRDVMLVETNESYIADYSVQLKKGCLDTISGWVQLNGAKPRQNLILSIPEAGIKLQVKSETNGMARFEFPVKAELWSPEHPKRYVVKIAAETDTITDTIGFRCIETAGSNVLLNKKPLFLKGVNIHEENPYKGSRAFSEADAAVLLNAAKELGCNMVRLAHYPHNENTIKLAERMGLMVWEELPVYQHIQFSDTLVPRKLQTMLTEMVQRDKNRCCVIIWSLSNETYSFTPNRDKELIQLTKKCRALDSTRIVTHVINTQVYEQNAFHVWDTLYKYSDLISLNEYIGWYVPWQGNPSDVKWELVCPDKPVFISEFGGEALYGSKNSPADEAAYWTEEYQETIYKNQVAMFETVPNLCGVCPWLLFDYKSLGRMHPVYQGGYNRKGLLSEKGEKKKAWYVMYKYYKLIKYF